MKEALPPSLREILPSDFESLYRLDQICFEPGIAYSREELRRFLGIPTRGRARRRPGRDDRRLRDRIPRARKCRACRDAGCPSFVSPKKPGKGAAGGASEPFLASRRAGGASGGLDREYRRDRLLPEARIPAAAPDSRLLRPRPRRPRNAEDVSRFQVSRGTGWAFLKLET